MNSESWNQTDNEPSDEEAAFASPGSPNPLNHLGSFSNEADPIHSVEQPLDDRSSLSEAFVSVDPRSIQVDMIASLIFSAIVTVAVVVTWVVMFFSFGLGWELAVAVAIGALLLVFLYALAVFWPRWDYARTSYRVDENGLEIRRGVIWRHQLTVPVGRVQHADVTQGPLQRMFGIGSLTVHTAGTQNSSVQLEGLAHDTAIELRDLIVHQRGEQDAV